MDYQKVNLKFLLGDFLSCQWAGVVFQIHGSCLICVDFRKSHLREGGGGDGGVITIRSASQHGHTI